MIAGWRSCCFRPRPGGPAKPCESLPDFAEIRRQLQTHKHLTLQLIWEEYRETQPAWLRLQPLLRVVRALEPKSGCGAAPGAPRRREDVRGLGRRHHPAPRPAHRRDHAGLVVRRRSRRQHVHLCARHAQPGSGQLGGLPRGGLRILPGHAETGGSRQPAHRRGSRLPL